MFELTTLDSSEPPHPASATEAIAPPKNTIEKSITGHFSSPCSRPIIFSGFASVAEKLSNQYKITYVDTHKPVLNTQKTVQGDVLEFIYFNASPCLVISATTSADWHYSFQLDKLITAIKRNQYQLALVEFYDAEAIKVSRSLTAALAPGCTEWQLGDITEKSPAHGQSVAEIHSVAKSPESSAKDCGGKTRLGIYHKQQLLAYFKRQLPMFEVELHSTLVPSDPSFTIAVKARKNTYQQ